ncbi:MAG: DUF1330 domain-containing protein [Burkholderiaceae bacterium]|nr:DUF1330 domain-containing protein [Burkholderiaceae bacterium]
MSTPAHEPRRAVDPTRESFKALFERAPAQGPVQMLNLLAFRDTAEGGGRTGRQAYAAYSKAVEPLLAAVGGRVLWVADAHHAFIAPPGETWDEVLLVEYPSRDAFVAMVQSPAYQAVVHHRSAALRDARLIVTARHPA